jgi:hypothetical protein
MPGCDFILRAGLFDCKRSVKVKDDVYTRCAYGKKSVSLDAKFWRLATTRPSGIAKILFIPGILLIITEENRQIDKGTPEMTKLFYLPTKA